MPPTMVVPTERRPSAPAPVAKTSGSDAENERERGHQDGAEPQLRGLDGGFGDGSSLGAQLFGELHDQNGVFGREADEHDQADLAVDIVGHAAQRHQAECAEHGHGHCQQDDEGQREALVLGREREIDDQDAEAEDDERLAGRIRFRRA